jgi:integrase
MFRDASSAKGSSGLRVRDDNPTLAVAPPERPKKGSGNKLLTFLYPSDYLTLVTAPTIWDAKQGLAKRHNANVARAKAAKRWMRIFTLCVYNCLRARELKGLRWEWCDLEHWVGKVELQANTNRDAKRTGKEDKDPKAGSFREFDFEPMVRPLMVKMHAEAKAAAGGKEPTGRIFPSFPGGKDLSSRLRKYLELAGCTRADLHTRNAHRVRMRFHDLRATSATWMAMRGDDPIHIQEVAGHASLATTEQYIRRVRRLRGADWGTPFPPIPSVVLDGWPAEKSEGGRPKTPAAAHKKERAAKGRDQAGTKTGPKITQAHVIAKTKSVPKGIRSVKPCSNQGKNVPLWSGRDQNRARSTSNAAPLLVPDAIAAALRSGLETAITEGRTGDAAALATELAARTRAVSDSKIVQLAGRRR